MTRYYLGVDGGQSSTTALLANENGAVMASGQSGPCNHVKSAEGKTKFLRAIGGCLEQIFDQSGLTPDVTFASVCLGFSGGSEDKEAYVREIIRGHRYKITHDADIALTGATGGTPGIMVIAGTGSMAFGSNEEGRTARAGGWGYIYGDDGGAFDLVRQAMRASLQMEEGWGSSTALRRVLLDATGARSINDLLHSFYADYPRTSVAAFAPLVSEEAAAGDLVAKEILEKAAHSLAWFVTGIHKNLFSSDEAVLITYVGGVFRDPQIREAFASYMTKAIPCEVRPPLFSPVAGALLQALRIDGNSSTLKGVPASDK
jgi:N-acetylglucosamine kinase-like BadF-type ATPase